MCRLSFITQLQISKCLLSLLTLSACPSVWTISSTPSLFDKERLRDTEIRYNAAVRESVAAKDTLIELATALGVTLRDVQASTFDVPGFTYEGTGNAASVWCSIYLNTSSVRSLSSLRRGPTKLQIRASGRNVWQWMQDFRPCSPRSMSVTTTLRNS